MSIDTKALREQARLARQLRARTGGQLAIDADQLDQLLDAADRLDKIERLAEIKLMLGGVK